MSKVTFAEHTREFTALRAQAEPLPTDSAAYTAASFFKSKHAVGADKPKAKTWKTQLSVDSQYQSSSPLKLASVGKKADMITLGTARPSPQFYPYESITFNCVDDASTKADKPITALTAFKGDEAYNLSAALNYGYPAGSPQSVRFITEHVEMMHNPPYQDWATSLTCGTTSAIEICFRIFCNPGDNILVENYSYTGTMVAAKAQRLKAVHIGMDEAGLSATELESTLANWDTAKGAKPHVLYTIPTGQNPTGVTQTEQRRREIYQIAEKHDLIIIEDDPYFFLQLTATPEQETPTATPESMQTYIDKLPSSYLSLDVSGRVVRLDSTSKILSPGLRLGWLTACDQIVELFMAYSEISVLAPSGPSQMMMYKLLDQQWGHEGFVQWLTRLSHQYSVRMRMMHDACTANLPADICTWKVPDAGMFIWITFDASKHPQAAAGEPSTELLLQVEEALYQKAKDIGVLTSKGSWFLGSPQSTTEVSLRVTFAAATEEQLKPGIELLGRAVKDEFKLQ